MRRKFFYTAAFLLAVLVLWGIFRYWEGTHDTGSPGHLLTYIRKPSDKTDKLIVFIHGIGSDARGSFTNERTGKYWPQLIADDPDLSSYAVVVASYKSSILRLGANVEQTALMLKQGLMGEGVYTRYSQVIFISHSMGGLIVRRMLVSLRNSGDDGAIKRVGAVFFFATPTSGARLADLVDWLSLNPQTHDLETSDFNTFLQSLDNDWEDLLRQRNQRSAGHPKIFCAYETQRTRVKYGTYVTVVPALYAKTICDETPLGFERDHFTLVKPEDASDDVYQWTRVRLLGIHSRIGQVMWNGGEALGLLVDRLHRAYQDNQSVPEIVRFSRSDEHTMRDLWIAPADYRRDSWAELFQAVAVDHSCLGVDVEQSVGIVELRKSGAVKSCGGRIVCENDGCD